MVDAIHVTCAGANQFRDREAGAEADLEDTVGVVNAYMSILIEGVAEALELAGRLGIDGAELAETIEGGPLDAPIADAKLHKMEQGDFAPEFPLEWALKDVDLAIGAAAMTSCASSRVVPPVACGR